ncbi:MAG: hypothetical protein R3176_09455 [Woeseiaceae bacterium]|nr:hypothetical protein [Woeseiaceae bacterium]
MRLMILVLALAAGCTEPVGAPLRASPIDMTGRLAYDSLDEASGLAISNRDPGLLWAVNDDGPPVVFALGLDGSKRGKVEIRKAGHRDWEDAASFVLDGTAWLLVADIGDNDARRRDVTIYVIEEPAPEADKTDIAWEIDFSYPDGPRDAEAAAVDVDNRRILILSKRDVPPRLYALPLRPGTDGQVMAEFLGVVDSLPQPTRADVNRAPLTDNWHWQPTGMSIAADNRRAMILTYGGVYIYSRAEAENWAYALRRPPLGLSLGRLSGAESVALGADGASAFVTTEGRRAPLLRIDLEGVNGHETEN